MKLNYKVYGEGFPLVILHGVFGSGDNWTTLARKFGGQYKTIVPDLRNHGRSPHDPVFNYDAMVKDLHELVEDLKIPEFHLIGHSMGGKVAMFFAEKYPKMLRKLVVVDIAPRQYQPHHQEILAGFKQVDLANTSSRQEAEEAMATKITESDVRQFLLKNLYRTEAATFDWRVNLQAIEANIEEVGKIFSNPEPVAIPTLFIRGGRSKYIQERDEADIAKQFSQSQIETVANAGHWVHAEQPEAVFELVKDFLNG